MIIVSVHMPKCGGASFKKLLANEFGSNFKKDANDKPVNKNEKQRNSEAKNFSEKFDLTTILDQSSFCIHGHFLPYKYEKLHGQKNVKFITWLREPKERIASHYYFWKRNENKIPDDGLEELRLKVAKEKWSFEKFIFCDQLQNLYTQFFWNFSIEKFDFIGITENFDEDVQFFSEKYLDKKIDQIPQRNINPKKEKSYFSDLGLIKEIKSFHKEDYDLYQTALNKKAQRDIENQSYNENE